MNFLLKNKFSLESYIGIKRTFYQINFKYFAKKTTKITFSNNKKPIPKQGNMNDSNTIDITESQKDFESIDQIYSPSNRSKTSGKVNKKETDWEDLEIKEKFNFDSFKDRNKEIFKDKNKVKPDEKTDKKNKEPAIDLETLARLNELIADDEEQENILKQKPGYKPLNNEGSIDQQETIQTEGESLEENPILVQRPTKNFVWGLGQQTKQKKCINFIKNI